MSPSKQKSHERQAARDRKALACHVASGGTSSNAYNPMSGTFHALESITSDIGAVHLNGRFKSIDDGEDNASSNGGGGELECISNNGSYSGESEDQAHVNGKEKQGIGKSSAVVGDIDKRDKARGKNERKHQRQKERRAQELRDKCTGYLMSRKLEALSQQLVAMGFPQEQATMALICNDGHVERSVAWLLEGGEGQVHEDWNSGGNPKIDISEELNYISEIEKAYKFSKPDIERAIVSHEGDLAKALESLQSRSRSLSPARDEGQSIQNASSSDAQFVQKEELSMSTPATPTGPGSLLQLRNNSAGLPIYQIRKDERVSIHSAKGRQQTNPASTHAPQEILTRGSAQPRKLSNPLTEIPNASPSFERRGHTQTGRIPVGVTKTQSQFPAQFASVSKPHVGLVFGDSEAASNWFSIYARDTNIATPSKESASTRRPHVLLRASSQPFFNISTSPAPSSISSPAVSSSSRSHSIMAVGSPSSVLYSNALQQGDVRMKEVNARKSLAKSVDGVSDLMGSMNTLGSLQSEPPTSCWGYQPSSATPAATSLNLTHHSRSPSGASYGLFTGWGGNFSQSSVDWSTGPIPNCDYTNIDWSMNVPPTGLQGVSSRLNSLALQEKGSCFWNPDDERALHCGIGSASYTLEATQGRVAWKVGGSGPIARESLPLESESNTVHEWTSPFAGKDLFSLPQVVPSPSL